MTTRVPDKQAMFAGDTRCAWRRMLRPLTVDDTATVAQWVVHCPKAHPRYNFYLFSLVHLRAIDGGLPVHKEHEWADHELVVIAFDGRSRPDPDAPATWRLSPDPDIIKHFAGLIDMQAAERLASMIDAVLSGRLRLLQSDFDGELKP